MKENKIIVTTMILNFFVALIKIVAGITFSFSTLIADSIQSFIDFLTDIISLIVNKIGKRRANKSYPFGYGQVYNLANVLTGILLFLIGIFILYQFFFFDGVFKPNKYLYIILVIILLLKWVVVYLLKSNGKKLKSELMLEGAKESYADFISTCVVLIVSLLTSLEAYLPEFISVDKIGSFGMAVYVFYTSVKIIIVNIKGMLTTSEENKEIENLIRKELDKINEVSLKEIRVIRMATYYNIMLKLKVDENLTIREYLIFQKELKTKLRSKNKEFRFIDIELA